MNEAINSSAVQSTTNDGPSTKTFNKSWGLMRAMVIFFGISQLAVAGAFILFAYQSNEIALQRAYFITSEGTVVGKSAYGDKRAREIEIRAHVSLFMSLMYGFDEHTFEDHTGRGLYLIGDDGSKILAAYEKAKTHEELIKTNGVVSIKMDSMWVNMESYPYKVRVFAINKFATSVQEIETTLWADMFLVDTDGRSEVNVAGLRIENFNIVKNNPVLK